MRPLTLALVVTLANAAKPVVVDDAAYLAFARQIAADPLDPYGFTLFWYTVPDPAMEILCPPVVPYWLAAGVKLFGEHVALLKLWMLPFVGVFAWSLRELLRRFARGTEGVVLPLVVLSPAILPTVNFMLDVPAVALGLASLVALTRGRVLGAGLLAALAIQTKYTALVVPPLLVWYGVTHGRWKAAVAAAGIAVLACVAWESLIASKYGVSHFVFHLRNQSSGGGTWQFVYDKLSLAPAMAGHLGCLAGFVGLLAGRAVGFPARWVAAAGVFWVGGFLLVALLPHDRTLLVVGKDAREKLALAGLVWRATGAGVLITATGCAWRLVRRGRTWRRSPGGLFVVGWVLLEVAGYFAMTPFPAARRLIGPTVALAVLAARFVRLRRVPPPRWVVPTALAFGIAVAAIDVLDAYPEKMVAGRAAAVIPDDGRTVWFAGHWGFQFYCERAGMKPLIPGQSRPAVGDYLVLPIYPDEVKFYRPHIGNVPIKPPADAVEVVAELVWDDPLAAQTVPNFYGGVDPVVGRGAPRLRVVVYRLREPWHVPGR